MPHGVLVRGALAFTGVRIDAAADLTETREYAHLSEADRLAKAVTAEIAWLTGQWELDHSPRIDLRYLSDPTARRLSCAVLARVATPSVAVAHLARERLLAVPRHVQASVLSDESEIGRWLAPFTPHAAGLAEIRKRIRVDRPNRPDAGVKYYLAVEPFTVAAPAWEPLWQAILAHPAPVLLSVGLAPFEVPPSTGVLLHQLATQYGRLGTPGRLPDTLFSAGRELAADAFAQDASRLYADAARRYRSRVFRIRITLASPQPLPDALAELAAATISPPQRPHDGTALTTTFAGATHVVVRPQPKERGEAWHNVSTVDFSVWDERYTGALPIEPPPVVRLVAELVDAREACAAARLPVAVHGHVPGFPVRAPGLALEVDYRAEASHVTLGRQLVGGRLAGVLGVPRDDLTRHALFVGTTGSGKTNSTLAFCEQLWCEHRVPFLVIEPVNTAQDDYRWLATRPGLAELVIFTVGNEAVAPFRLNPFEAPAGVRVGSHIAGLLACFDAAFGLWDPLPHIYNRALRDTYRACRISPDELSGERHTGNWPTLRDFVASMHQATERLDYAGEIRANILAASRLRAEALAEGACASTLDTARSYPLEALLQRPVVLELAEIGDNEKEQSLLAALFLQAMTEQYKATRTGGGLQHVTIIEEAHRLLGRPTPAVGEAREGNAQARAAQAFANTLAENRKYGEGLVIVEQVPSKLIEDAYKNTNLKVMHRLPAADDRFTIGSTMRLSEDQQRYVSTLPPFTAFAYHDAVDRPALIQVPNIRAEAAHAAGLDRAPLATESELSRRFATLASDVPTVDAAVAPFEECAGCRHRCQFRAPAGTAVLPTHGVELKSRVESYPRTRVGQRQWWGQTTSWVRRVADQVHADTPTAEARADYEACVFVHIARRAWRRGGLAWVRLYRQRRTSP